ncbi:hypothetical protein H310_01830 [Aphanomyces invadans]|uniref:Uncharacterized protein n=1 Tax=Aphanomyces invadans TaxID=157072 RepID=A0A024UN36_9STRA|nr:hypothetical protein H310_01830 [Aphanomyces invadans]ETW07267.1 hypothetical protein H310_01830 [Aphanomyces invadans]|eukprot:XP_008863360.1 hypothetical protein H310_01830 [Aphanomyces invadans]
MPSPTNSAHATVSHQCLYRNKVCLNVRAFKKNGQLHSLCEFHRLKANSNQRKLERKKRDNTPPLSEFSTTKPPRRACGVKELWILPTDVDDTANDTGDEDIVIWVQPIRVKPPPHHMKLRRGGRTMDGANPNVNIGNYKGVMLCNRPFNGVVSGPPTTLKDTDHSSKHAPFLTGIQPPPIGQNVPIFNEPLHAIKRDKKNTALSKHKKWLHDLQKERDRLEEALMVDEEEKQKRRDRFSKREAEFRAQVRRTNPEEDAADVKGSKRPMWALTKETADEKRVRDEEEDVDRLLDFANNLDLDSFMDDVELKAHVAQVNEQLAKLQEVVNQEEGEERKAEVKEMLQAERAERQMLNAAALSRLDTADAKGYVDDDAVSVASTVLSECKSIRSVHSTRSVMALARRAEDKLLNGRLTTVPEGASGAVPSPHVVTHDEECGMRLQNKHLPSNLPYIHRNPAI